METLVNSIGKRNSFLGSKISKRKEDKMKIKEGVAVTSLIIVAICLIILPRWYYTTNNPADTIDLIYAIFTTAAVEIALLGGLIIAFGFGKGK